LAIGLNYVPATVAKSSNWRNGLVWDQKYQIMRLQQSQLPSKTILAARRYQDASQLAFYERERWHELPSGHAMPALNLWGRSNHYAHVWLNDSYRGEDLLVLSGGALTSLQPHFCKVRKIGTYTVQYLQQDIRTFSLYYGQGFLGRPDVLKNRPMRSFDRSICKAE